jgi:hypothetical protein
MPRVQISARLIRWPTVCACCCAPARESEAAVARRHKGVRVVRVEEKSWPIPYCSRCLDHREAFADLKRAKRALAGYQVGAVLLLVGARRGLPDSRSPVGSRGGEAIAELGFPGSTAASRRIYSPGRRRTATPRRTMIDPHRTTPGESRKSSFGWDTLLDRFDRAWQGGGRPGWRTSSTARQGRSPCPR